MTWHPSKVGLSFPHCARATPTVDGSAANGHLSPFHWLPVVVVVVVSAPTRDSELPHHHDPCSRNWARQMREKGEEERREVEGCFGRGIEGIPAYVVGVSWHGSTSFITLPPSPTILIHHRHHHMTTYARTGLQPVSVLPCRFRHLTAIMGVERAPFFFLRY